MPSIARNLRRRAGIPHRNKQASTAPPPAYQGNPRCPSFIAVHPPPEIEPVVVTVSVAVPALVPVILTGVVDPKLSVGGIPVVGLSAAVSTTLPVKPFAGVTVIVDVFPVVAPGATVTAVPTTVKLVVGGGDVTVTEPWPVVPGKLPSA